MKISQTIAGFAACAILAGCGSISNFDIRPAATFGGLQAGINADYYQLGRKQLYAGNVALALEAFQLDLARQGDTVRTLNGIAICYDVLGRHEIAARYFDRATSLDPASDITTRNVAVSGERLRELQMAANTKAAAVSDMPKMPAVPLVKVERVTETEWSLSKPAQKPEAPAKAPIVPAETAAQSVPAPSMPTTPPHAAAEASQPHQAAGVIRLVNGTGRTRMARRMAAHLGSEGISVNRLANAAQYNHKVTVIEYSDDFAALAEDIAAHLPAKVTLRRSARAGLAVEITLGSDLNEFDASLVPHTTKA